MDIEDMERWLNETLDNVEEGYRLLRDLVSENNIGYFDCIILLPTIDKELNYVSLLYLNQFMKAKRYSRAFLLTCDENVLKHGGQFSDNIKKVMYISEEMAGNLIKFYYLRYGCFVINLYICSLNQPVLRDFERMRELCGFSLEQAVCYWIYLMADFKEEERLIQIW